MTGQAGAGAGPGGTPVDNGAGAAAGLLRLTDLLHARFQPTGAVIAGPGAPVLDVDEDLLERYEVAMPVAATLALADSLCGHGRLLAASLDLPGATRSATATVARGVVEAGVRLWYLSTAGYPEERTRRYLLDRVHDLQEEERLFAGVSGSRRAAALREADRLRQLRARAQAEPLLAGHSRPSPMMLLDAVMGSPGAGTTAARLLAGLAHARPAVLLRDWTVEQPVGEHIRLVRLRESQEDLQAFCLPAVVCLWRAGVSGLRAIGRPLARADEEQVERLVAAFGRSAG